MRIRITLATLLAALCGLGRPGPAEAAAVFDFRLLDVTATTARLSVGLTFQVDGNPADNAIDAIQLGVRGSSPQLTGDDLDFTRFRYTAALPSTFVTPFDPSTGILLQDFDDDLVARPEAYLLGTLEVDVTGLAPHLPLLVTLAGGPAPLLTDASGTIGGQPVLTFAEAGKIAFAQPNGVAFQTVPEPSALASAVIGLLALGASASFRARPRPASARGRGRR